MGVGYLGEGRLRNLLGSLAVLAVAGGIAVGLPALDRGVPAERPVPAGQPYLIGGGVGLIPPPGAMVDVTKTRPRADRGTVLFVVSGVRYVVVVAPYTGTLAAAARRLRGKIESNRGYQVTTPQAGVEFGSALRGLGGGYAASGRVGRYLVFLLAGKVVEITISGSRADLGGALTDIEASIGTLSHRAAP